MATGLRGAIRACVGSSIKSLFSLPWSGLVLLRRSNMVVLAAVPQSYHRAGDAKEKVPRGEKTQRRRAWSRSAHTPTCFSPRRLESLCTLTTRSRVNVCSLTRAGVVWGPPRLLSAIWRPWLPRRGYIHWPSPNNHCTHGLGSSWPVSRSSGRLTRASIAPLRGLTVVLHETPKSIYSTSPRPAMGLSLRSDSCLLLKGSPPLLPLP